MNPLRLMDCKVEKKENECFIYDQQSFGNDKGYFTTLSYRRVGPCHISLMLLLAEIVLKKMNTEEQPLAFNNFQEKAPS